MPSYRLRKSSSLVTKLAELSFAAPQVVAHRLARMALSGQTLSKRDKKEFDLMVAEKRLAFGQSWNAMAVEATRANQALAMSFFKSFWTPTGRKPSVRAVSSQIRKRPAIPP